MKTILLLASCILTLNIKVSAQELKMRKLTNEDQKNKIYKAYEFNATDHYAAIKLSLYKDGSFYYTSSSFNRNVFSDGKWSQKHDTLILISNIRNGHIPIELSYTMDSTNLINGFKVGIVRNLKGQEMPDGLVAINTESNKCAPSYGICDKDYNKIDSIKIIFENGLKSKWMKVSNKQYVQVTPVVQADYLISGYMPFENAKFLIKKGVLTPIN